MQALKDKIREEGKYLGDGILKIDAILNHQIDPNFMQAMGEEIADRFRPLQPNRILTAEVSGIGPAVMAGLALNVPVLYARKHRPITMTGHVYLETAPSATHGGEVTLMVAADYLPAGERVLIVDDFLASGDTLLALARIAQAAGLTIVGFCPIVEKQFQGGRAKIQQKFPGVPFSALVTITELNETTIEFA